MNSDYTFAKEYIERGEERVTSLYLTSTSRCNKTCEYCYMRENNLHGELTYDMVREVLDKNPDINHIILLGGEPLLNLPLLDNLLRNTNAEISISTGLGVSPDVIEEFLNIIRHNERRISLQVSYDGKFSQRNKKDYQKLLCALLILSAYPLGILSIKHIVTSDNYRVDETRKEVEVMLKREIPFQFEFATGEPNNTEQAIQYINDVIKKEVELFEKDARKNYFNDIDKFLINTSTSTGFFLSQNGCRAFYGGAIFLNADGTRTNCCMPNMKESSLDKCYQCSLLPFCGIRCPVMVEDGAQCKDAFMYMVAFKEHTKLR